MNGNLQSQEILYNKYKTSVKNFLKAKYSTYYDLDDDVSEILIKVFLNLNTFDVEKSKFSSWVFTIAKNYMIDKWRSTSGTATVSINNVCYTTTCDTTLANISCNGYISNNMAFTSNGSSTSCNADFENCSSISYISTQLSPTDFALLDMKYVQGYDYNEIGKEFNVTSSTISNRVNYIKSKLKKNNSDLMFDDF